MGGCTGVRTIRTRYVRASGREEGARANSFFRRLYTEGIINICYRVPIARGPPRFTPTTWITGRTLNTLSPSRVRAHVAHAHRRIACALARDRPWNENLYLYLPFARMSSSGDPTISPRLRIEFCGLPPLLGPMTETNSL